MHKLGKQECRKCGGNMNIRFIPRCDRLNEQNCKRRESGGMDIEPTGMMKATCTECGFSEMIDTLDSIKNN